MRVALNATCFNHRPSGSKQRFVGIYRELAQYMPDTEFVILEPCDYNMQPWFDGLDNIKTIATPIRSEGHLGRLLRAGSFWSEVFSNERFDIVEGFHLPMPTAPGTKKIFTLHDIRRLKLNGNIFEQKLFLLALKRAIGKADALVTVSESMKKEILPYCGGKPVHVVYNGVNNTGKLPSINELDNFRSRFHITSGFLLAVGHLEVRKNYNNLIEAVGILRRWGVNKRLLIVGYDSGMQSNLENKIRCLGLENIVSIASGLSDKEIQCAYRLCDLFVFSSFYEGFGIPILEAMASGCPMALSDIPVFREITENQSAYFSCSDPYDIARVIYKVISSPSERSRLSEYGFNRVKEFFYSRIAESYAQIYKSL